MRIPDVTDTRAGRQTTNNVVRLALAQALAGANGAAIFATGAIVGASTAPSADFSTLPLSMFAVGMAAATIPIGWIARRYGRKAAFLCGSGCGIAAGLLGAEALLLGSFALFCTATLFGGFYAAVAASFRFAVTDGVDPAFRPKALSWVMAGGVFAGVLGPQLVTWTMYAWTGHLFVVSYLAQAGLAAVTMAILAGVSLPRPAITGSGLGRSLAEIVRQPRFVVAVICAVVAYVLMNMVMTAAPLAMQLCGLPLNASNSAIQWHIVAMYGPSFFTGSIIARLGAGRTVALGFMAQAAAAVSSITGVDVPHFSIALILLGLGWNFAFLGASALVLDTHRPEERTKVQSLNDFLVFGTMTIGSFSSGALLASRGWAAVNWLVFPAVAIALAALLILAGTSRRSVRAG